jgi:hypothetical protein
MNKQIKQIVKLVKLYRPESVMEVEDCLLNSRSASTINDLMSEYIYVTNDGERVDDEISCHPLFNDILDEVCANLKIWD